MKEAQFKVANKRFVPMLVGCPSVNDDVYKNLLPEVNHNDGLLE